MAVVLHQVEGEHGAEVVGQGKGELQCEYGQCRGGQCSDD